MSLDIEVVVCPPGAPPGSCIGHPQAWYPIGVDLRHDAFGVHSVFIDTHVRLRDAVLVAGARSTPVQSEVRIYIKDDEEPYITSGQSKAFLSFAPLDSDATLRLTFERVRIPSPVTGQEYSQHTVFALLLVDHPQSGWDGVHTGQSSVLDEGLIFYDLDP